MSEGFDKLAGGVGKAVETVPDIYDDALKPAAQESGKTLALIPRAIIPSTPMDSSERIQCC